MIGKRSRGSIDYHEIGPTEDESPKTKKATKGDIRSFVTTNPSTVLQKTQAKTKPTTHLKKKPSAKAKPTKSKSPKESYDKAIDKIEKKADSLDKRVKAGSVNKPSITSDNYAAAMTAFNKDVLDLLEMDPEGPRFAFNLMLSIGEHSHGDLNWGFKMSGYGDSEVPYSCMDKIMLQVIERLVKDGAPTTIGMEEPSLPTVSHRFTEKDAMVGPMKTSGGPNKQQRGWIAKQSVEWQRERSQALKERREQAQDWVTNGLNELVDHRDYIEQYGLEGYFTESIVKLKELKAGKTGVQVTEAE